MAGELDAERLHRKQRLAAAFRLFARFGYDEGLAGHVTARDPEHPDRFWVNPLGRHFGLLRVSDLVCVDAGGTIVEGQALLNQAAFAIHSQIHETRPDVVAAAHGHSVHGKAWSSLGRLLAPITQDACAFYDDHVVFDEYTGVVNDPAEGKRIAAALGDRKAAILRNHGLLTVGGSVEEAVWWFVAMDRCCHAQLLADAAGAPVAIDADMAAATREQVGTPLAGLVSFGPLYDWITSLEPDLLD